jgi:hypothetical protein
MARVLLPPQLVHELSPVGRGCVRNGGDSLSQRDQPVSDVRRQHRRATSRYRVHLAAALGVAADVERRQRRVGSTLSTTSGRLCRNARITDKVTEVPIDPVGGSIMSGHGQRGHALDSELPQADVPYCATMQTRWLRTSNRSATRTPFRSASFPFKGIELSLDGE